MFDALLLTLEVLLPVWPAKRLAETLFPSAGPMRGFFAALWCAILLVHFQMLILGTLGLATLPWSLAFGVIVLLAATRLPAAERPLTPLRSLAEWFAATTPHARVGAVVMGVAMLYTVVRLAGWGPSFMWDDWAYHGPVVTGMMHSDSTRFFRHNMAMYYPFNPHLLNFYMTMATGTLAYTWMATTLWVFVALMAWATLSLHVPERGRDLFLLAGGVFGLNFETRWFINAFCSADLVVAIVLLSAYAVARPWPGASRRETLLNALFCGLIVGYAVGTKHFYAVPSVAAALTCLYWATWGRAEAPTPLRAWREPAAIFGLGFLGVCLSGSYWYIYNIVLTGNPLYPLKFAIFPGTIEGRHFRDTTMMDWGRRTDWSWAFLYDAWLQFLCWPFYAGCLMVVGLVGGLVACGFLAWRWARRQPADAFPVGVMPGMLASAWLLLLAYPNLPYSGNYNVTEDFLISRRFLLFCFHAGLVAWAHVGCWEFRGRTPLATPTRVALWFVLLTTWPFVDAQSMILPQPEWNLKIWIDYILECAIAGGGWDVPGWIAAAVGLLVLAVVRLAPGLVARPLVPASRVPGLGLGLLGAAVLATGLVRPIWHPGPHTTRFPYTDRGLLNGVHALEYLPDGARVGSLSQSSWEIWWIYGSRGQFEPVFLHRNGAAIEELHTMQAKGLVDNNDPDKLPRLGLPWVPFEVPRPELFAERLRAARVDYIFCTKYPEFWGHSAQRDAMSQLPEFTRIYDDGFNEIWQRRESPDQPLTRVPSPHNLLAPAETGSGLTRGGADGSSSGS